MTKRVYLSHFLYFVLFAAVAGWLYQQNQPANIVSPKLNSRNTLQCVSYSPYYGKDQSPLVVGTMISPAQIDADLKKLASVTDCVRTYSVGQGMDYVPQAAQKLGLKVYLGAWIGWVHADNQKEIKLAVARANEYPETIKALIIGNEVLLRQEQKPAAMQQYLREAKNSTITPVTYADVWEFWIKNKEMESSVDFITVHILPYWENNPVAIEQGVQHAINVMTQLQSTFKKPILIGETGWPSIGRQRFESKPSLINQARYVREFLQAAYTHQWQYNVIEAVDQPWKRALEGTVGGYWGIYNTDLSPKFSLTQAVAERHDGCKPFYLAVMGAMLLTALALFKWPAKRDVIVTSVLMGGLSSLIGLLQLEYLIAACRDYTEWAALGGMALIGWLVAIAQPYQLLKTNHSVQRLINWAQIGLMITAIIASYLIYTDGRYRDYPNLLLLLPALIAAISWGLNWCKPSPLPKANYLLGPLAVGLAVVCFLEETSNTAAGLWLGLNGLMMLALWPRQRLNNSLT